MKDRLRRLAENRAIRPGGRLRPGRATGDDSVDATAGREDRHRDGDAAMTTTRVEAPDAVRPAPPRPRAARAPADPARRAEDRRLATLHLRLGGLTLARSELERLDDRGELDTSGVADLAEARWRSGELERAAEAAARHLADGGGRPIARVIAAEAAAAAGRPVEARAHVDALGPVDTAALEALFAGMPRRAFWPSAPSTPVGPPDTLFGTGRPGGSGRSSGTGVAAEAGEGGVANAAADHGQARSAARGSVPAPAAAAEAADGAGDEATPAPGHGIPSAPGTPDDEPAMAGLWDESAAAAPRARFGTRRLRSGAGSGAGRGPADPARELESARAELGSGNAGEAARGLARLALVLRLDPALAPAVLEVVGHRRDVAAHLVRGDAYRLVGRHLEAEAAFAAAAAALDGPGHDHPS